MDELKEYLDSVVAGFKDDPASSAYQRGYLSAIVELGQSLIRNWDCPKEIINQLEPSED